MAECAEDVTAWLEKLGLPEYTENFLSAGYCTLQQCATLSKADLTAIGIVKLGHICRLVRDLETMKDNGELERNPSSPGSLSSSNVSPAEFTSSDQHKDTPSRQWSKPFRRLASFIKHTKSNISSAHKTKVKSTENDEDSPRIQRTWSLHKTIAEKGRLLRRYSMSVTRNEVNSGSKFKNGACKSATLPNGNTLVNGHEDPVDQLSAPSLSLKEPSPPPLPPKDSVSSSATVSVPSSPAQKSGSMSEQSNRLEAVMPTELPPELPPKKSVKIMTSTTDKSNGNVYEKPTLSNGNVYEIERSTLSNGNVYDRPKALSSTRVTGSPPDKYKQSLHVNSKEQKLSIPAWKAVVNLPCNNKSASLPALPQKQVMVPLSPSSYGDDSDNVFKHNRKSVSGHCMVMDKYVSIHNDHSSGSINIFVSKPECIEESSDSSEEEGDECNGKVEVISESSFLCDDIHVLPQNTSSVSPRDKKASDGVKNLSTAQKPPHGLPSLEFKHPTSLLPFDAPLSAPPVGVEAALPTSVVKCALFNGMTVSSDDITGAYSQLRLSPEEIKQQVVAQNFNTETHPAEKEQTIVKKYFKVKYPFLVEKVRREVQKTTQSSEIQNIRLVNDPCCAIEIEGTKTGVEQAETEILRCILLLENGVTSSTLHFVNPFARPALNSPEMLQLCKELHDKHTISLKVQLQPTVLSSAAVTFNKSDVMVQMCEGDVALDSCHTFINFTDGNLTMSDEVKAMLDQAEINRITYYVKRNGPQPPGKAFNFRKGRSSNTIIIHAVLPEWVDGNSGEGSSIASAVMESLNLSEQHKVTSISLPFLSSVDSHLPLDVLSESCLSAVHNFAIHSHSIKVVRLVLPVNMIDKFLDHFTNGVFKQFVIVDEPDVTDPDNMKEFCDLGNSAWLWEDDDGKYNYFQSKDNNLLNKESAICFNASCDLKIGPSVCRVNFKNMTQTNMSTFNRRKVACIPLGAIWQFRNHEGKWKKFSPQVTLMIEAMYSTGNEHDLTISSCSYSYDFMHMMQLNLGTKQKTGIRRINGAAMYNDVHNTAKSKITILGSVEDINVVEEKLLRCLESLIAVHYVDIQRKFIPAIEKCIKQTQRSNSVKVVKTSETDLVAKYSVTGYGNCVQKAAIEMYKVTAMASCSVQKPREWELQSEPVELIDILQGSPEWTKICARMRKTLKCNVISVKRIQNKFLWEKYVQHKELMSHKGPQSMTELELFHGTRSNPPKCIYESEEGFDMRYSREGLWGLGNYFAENANYASCFAYKRFSDILQVFLVKVLVGDSSEILPDGTLRMPPFKPNSKVHYDTVNGHTKGSKVYITYSNDKAYPFYLISYTVENSSA